MELPTLLPFLNIGVMSLKPDENFFNHMMTVLESGELEKDEWGKERYERGVHQPWLDHYLMKFSVRLGYARFTSCGITGFFGGYIC